ncbi:MAG TPA: PstS family phosphate ABC transporter substrate-binding protein [Pyrinomonadaceae bacterium]|nr:PstS family phosphate ABC transporter substrate-binding protein [Pyrinomonadaceae bacterium]
MPSAVRPALALVAISLALTTFSCSGGTNSSGGAAVIKIDGSSTVFPVTEAVAEEFQKEKQGRVNVTVGISGTGGGFKKFSRGEIDVADASRPILTEEMAQAKANGIDFIELPIAFDALTVVVNNQNTWVSSITVEDLKKIWSPEAQGKITRWNQVRPEWPNEEIALFGAGADSGTFDYFTEAIVGKAKSSRGDYTASEDDNVLVQGIEGNKYALGYIPYAYYAPHSNRMKALSIEWKKNKIQGPVMPSPENVLAGTYNPLSRPLFIYVSRKSLEKPAVKEFVEFYLKHVGVLAKEVKYLPLPETAYQMAKDRLQNAQTGSAFGGVPEVGLPVEEILKRTPKT